MTKLLKAVPCKKALAVAALLLSFGAGSAVASKLNYQCMWDQITGRGYMCFDAAGYYYSSCYCPRGGGAAHAKP